MRTNESRSLWTSCARVSDNMVIHPRIHSLTQPSTLSHSLTSLPIIFLSLSCAHSLTHSLTLSLTHSLTHSITLSLTHSLTHLLTGTLAWSLSFSFNFSLTCNLCQTAACDCPSLWQPARGSNKWDEGRSVEARSWGTKRQMIMSEEGGRRGLRL